MKTEILKTAKLKSTKKRQLILSLLEDEAGALTAEDIFVQTKKVIPMSVSTIYRALNTLSEKGILIKNLCQDGKTYYQMNRRLHQHQLVCSICKKVVPIDCCPLKELEDSLMEKTGYTITGHVLEFMGICPNCLGEKI